MSNKIITRIGIIIITDKIFGIFSLLLVQNWLFGLQNIFFMFKKKTILFQKKAFSLCAFINTNLFPRFHDSRHAQTVL